MALILIALGLVPAPRDLPTVAHVPDPRWTWPRRLHRAPARNLPHYRHVDREPHPRAA